MLLVKLEIERCSSKQRIRERRKETEKDYKEKLRGSLKNGKKRKCKNEFRAKGLLSLSPTLSSLLPLSHPLDFCSSGLGTKTCFFLPPPMAPAKRKEHPACVPGGEEMPRPGRVAPVFHISLKQLGELACGFGERQLLCSHHPNPSNLHVPLHPTQCQKSKPWHLRASLGFQLWPG